MNVNPQWVWIAILVIAALVIIGLIAAGVRRTRTARLREHFGPEYDKVVQRAGKRTVAEQELVTRTEEAKQFEIRPLSAGERDNFLREWNTIEGRFVDRPMTAVVQADELITTIMRTRGYPIADFEKYANLLSVEYPRIVEHYRAGHKAIESRAPGTTSTEELRQAMLHYRTLFDELVGTRGRDVERPSVTGSIARDEDRPRH